MIGVGILSYNRPNSISRLVESILKYTSLDGNIKIVISDDASSNKPLQGIYDKIDSRITILRNRTRAGIAGNTNRCLRFLDGSDDFLLLNDDVQVLNYGWHTFYTAKMLETSIHHFCYREPGVYGAKPAQLKSVNGHNLLYVPDKPHGAVLAFDAAAFRTVGYFDTEFGLYGMEHVDWSTRVFKSGIQPSGYFDVPGSNEYFKINSDQSAVENRSHHLKAARKKYFGSERPIFIPYK